MGFKVAKQATLSLYFDALLMLYQLETLLRKYTDEEKAYALHYDLQQKR